MGAHYCRLWVDDGRKWHHTRQRRRNRLRKISRSLINIPAAASFLFCVCIQPNIAQYPLINSVLCMILSVIWRTLSNVRLDPIKENMGWGWAVQCKYVGTSMRWKSVKNKILSWQVHLFWTIVSAKNFLTTIFIFTPEKRAKREMLRIETNQGPAEVLEKHRKFWPGIAEWLKFKLMYALESG